MDNRHEVQQFLNALRARITPEQAGLTVFGGERRVPGRLWGITAGTLTPGRWAPTVEA